MKKELTNTLKKAGSAIGNTASKVSGGVKSATAGITEGIKSKKLEDKLKKLNPLFPEEYGSPDFHTPNLVAIVDDAVRRDEELCRGAIGWRSFVEGVEILYLYDEFAPQSGIEFIPELVCDTAYYVDPHNRSRFIRVDYLFRWAQQEKLAELAHIAYCLGADSYSVSLVDQTSSELTEEEDYSASGGKGKVKLSASGERKRMRATGAKSKALMSADYTEARDPVKPELSWFRNDKSIQGLIMQRCEQNVRMNNIDIVLSGTDYATMSQSMSAKVDAAVAKIGFKGKAELKASSKEEHSHSMVFHLEFKKRGLFK
ncbi:MAG: hypothetical protein IJQ80_07140 [Clostridia bacterium]|nr:hypothetical protein [Clostridia bacterium]